MNEKSHYYPVPVVSSSSQAFHGYNNKIELTNRAKTKTSDACEEMDDFITLMAHQINDLGGCQKTTNEIFKLCQSLIRQTKQFCEQLIEDSNGMNALQALHSSTDYICSKFAEYDSNYKRKKRFEESEGYVEPKELCMGVRMHFAREEETLMSFPEFVPCKFQYISINKNILAKFQRSDVKNAYLSHNDPTNSNVNGSYSDFRSGNVFKTSKLFQENPYALQIQISTDDFEVANPLGSKATLHKMTAIYFSILNMPPEFLSKLDNLHLVALCNTDDLKTKFTDFNDLWRLIVKEISILEETGIDVGDGLILKGTIVNLCFDNLGANTSLGFIEAFNTSGYCRVCECDRSECQTLCKEISSKIRDKKQYDQHLNTIAESEHVDFKQTMGVKRYCELNDLKYFDIFQNASVDIMHDLSEGAMHVLLYHLFTKIISAKILTANDIQNRAQSYDYGFLNKRNTPSLVSTSKKNLNQNASQTKCLFVHIPYIFHDIRNHKELKDKWVCFQSLLRISQIAYSTTISEKDIDDLEESIQTHHSTIQKRFKISLTPKHHFLTHYCRIIRAMGPLKYMSMMRYESKHKQLKGYAKYTNNFVNLSRTLATKHQQHSAGVKDSYVDEFEHGAPSLIDVIFEDTHKDILSTIFSSDETVYQTDWLKSNGRHYKPGLLICHSNFLFEIDRILFKNNEYFFFCHKYNFVKIDKFLNSIQIKKYEPVLYSIIKFGHLASTKLYEKKNLNNGIFIILDTLDLKNIYSL